VEDVDVVVSVSVELSVVVWDEASVVVWVEASVVVWVEVSDSVELDSLALDEDGLDAVEWLPCDPVECLELDCEVLALLDSLLVLDGAECVVEELDSTLALDPSLVTVPTDDVVDRAPVSVLWLPPVLP
jgi:hypothetical protein